jgi:cell division protease FtsH
VNKRWRNAGLYALLAIVLIALGTTFFDRPPEAQGTLKYSEFLKQVQEHKIEKVTLFSDRSKAIVTRGEEKLQVNLLPDNGLIDTLTKNDVDITVRPPQDDSILVRLAGSLIFPVLLWGCFSCCAVRRVGQVAKR